MHVHGIVVSFIATSFYKNTLLTPSYSLFLCLRRLDGNETAQVLSSSPIAPAEVITESST